MSGAEREYHSFSEFYPFYLTEHSSRTSRRLHVIGTGLAMALVVLGLAWNWRLLWMAPIAGYGLAWIGHFIFERNQPATFRYPLWSLMGDFKLFFEVVLSRQRPF